MVRSSKRTDLRRLDQCISGVRRFAGRLHPARQQVVDLHRREIGFDARAADPCRRADAAYNLDRDRAGDGAAEIDAEPAASGFVNHRLQVQFGVGRAFLLAQIDRGRSAVDFHVAVDLVAVGRGAHPQRGGFDLLPHQHFVGGEIGQVGGDGVARGFLRRVAANEHVERDLGVDGAAARCRIERNAEVVAQRVACQQRGRRRHRAVDAEMRARRRRFGMRVGNLEHPAGDTELAPGRHIHGAAAEVDGGGAAGDAGGKIGVADRRQFGDRSQRRAAGLDFDRQAFVVHGRTVGLEIGQRGVAGDDHALDDAAGHVARHPLAHMHRGEDRPHALHHLHRHAGARRRRRRDAARHPSNPGCR